jgi:hypothetical protein
MGLHRVVDILGTHFAVEGTGLLTRLIATENNW